MRTIATYSLGALAYMTATEGKDPNTFVTKQPEASSGIIWNEDATLCLMMDNFFIDKKVKDGQDWKKQWEIISKTPARKQRHLDDGATPRCEDTKVFWSEYCFNTLTNSYADDEAKWLAEDPNVEKALFRVSVHADMNDIFCIIPEGDYCLKEEPGTYKMQSIGSGRKFEKFRFLPFDGVNPDYYFDFDDDDILVYGSDSTGWEKLNVQAVDNGKLIKRINVGNDLNKVQKKRLKPVNFGAGQSESCSFGYAEASNGQCVKNICTCENGVAADLCDAAQTAICKSCFDDLHLSSSGSCNQCADGYYANKEQCAICPTTNSNWWPPVACQNNDAFEQLSLTNPRWQSGQSFWAPERAIDGLWLIHGTPTGTPSYSTATHSVLFDMHLNKVFYVDLPEASTIDDNIQVFILTDPRTIQETASYNYYKQLVVSIGGTSCSTDEALDDNSYVANYERFQAEGILYKCAGAVGETISLDFGPNTYGSFAEIVATKSL